MVPCHAVSWIETYRGTVYRWELDNVDHFTVAFYFQRFADATLGLLESLGLGPPYMARTGRGMVPVDAYVRYLREKIDRPFGLDSIETVRGAGYRLRKHVDS